MLNFKHTNFATPAQLRSFFDPPGLIGQRPAEKLVLDFDRINQIAPVYSPYFDIKETSENYVFVTDLPGLQENDVDVDFCDGCLTIVGEREQDALEDGDYYYALDRHFGSFCLTFQLPKGVAGERVNAQMANGVLTVKVPKLPKLPKAPCGVGGVANRVAVARDH